jgi:predicted MFS family arabinose efflux permease
MPLDSTHPTQAPLARPYIAFIVAACLILLVTMGIRQSLGLFVQPIVLNTGMSIAAVSLAMAIGQVVWGFGQPIAGLLAERYGVRYVALLGLLFIGCGLLTIPVWHNATGIFATFGILSAVGAGFASISLFIGAVVQIVPEHRTGFVSGMINAASSLGQFIFAPLVQLFLSMWTWTIAAASLGLIALASIPLLYWVTGKAVQSESVSPVCCGVAVPAEKVGFRHAWSSRNYRLLHLGFFTCGFHIAFLVTHLPGVVSMCGLPTTVASNALAVIGFTNVVGSLAVGQICQKFSMAKVLGSLYLVRVLAVLFYMAAPKTDVTWYLFAGLLGMTWLATVPPTAGLVGGLFGLRNISTLFGLTMLSHQIGAFLGAWLGGLAVQYTHSFDWMWWADATLALIAAVASFAIVPQNTEKAQAIIS